MRNSKSFHESHLTYATKQSAKPTKTFAKLPQIQAIRTLHEENIRKERVAQQTQKKNLQLFTQIKQNYIEQKQKRIQERLLNQQEESKERRTQIQKQKSSYLNEIKEKKFNIEKKKQRQRKKHLEKEINKQESVIEKHRSEYQKLINKKRLNSLELALKIRRQKKQNQIRDSEEVFQQFLARMEQAENNRSNITFDQQSLVKTLNARLRKSQNIAYDKQQRKSQQFINKSVESLNSFHEHQDKFTKDLMKRTKMQKKYHKEQQERVEEKKMAVVNQKDQKIKKMFKVSESKLIQANVARQENQAQQLFLKKQNRQMKENAVRSRLKVEEENRMKNNEEKRLKDHEDWLFNSKVKLYKNKVIQKSIHESSTLALQKSLI